MNGGSVEDMGLGKGDLANLTSAFNWVMKTAYDASAMPLNTDPQWGMQEWGVGL